MGEEESFATSQPLRTGTFTCFPGQAYASKILVYLLVHLGGAASCQFAHHHTQLLHAHLLLLSRARRLIPAT